VVGDISADGRTAFADPTEGTGTAGRAAFSSGTLTNGISSLSTGIAELASGASSLTAPTPACGTGTARTGGVDGEQERTTFLGGSKETGSSRSSPYKLTRGGLPCSEMETDGLLSGEIGEVPLVIVRFFLSLLVSVDCVFLAESSFLSGFWESE
jgi:X-X-X-Leu-X-X-Gly heptad repeat protein